MGDMGRIWHIFSSKMIVWENYDIRRILWNAIGHIGDIQPKMKALHSQEKRYQTVYQFVYKHETFILFTDNASASTWAKKQGMLQRV